MVSFVTVNPLKFTTPNKNTLKFSTLEKKFKKILKKNTKELSVSHISQVLSLSEISHYLIFPKYKSKLGNHGNYIAFKLKFVISSSVSLCLS